MWSLVVGIMIAIVALTLTGKDKNREDFWEDTSFEQQNTHEQEDTGHCDGNCDRCPAHYGYRYGRWYYGHGHQHGCQRGGNGGASGRTNRD